MNSNNQYSDSNEQKKSDGFFAKIPTIYLELHHFNFSHGAYQSSSQRFLGRDEIRNRLRAILTHSKNNSGSYLITGDRGVGKTSLVNKVLEELSSKIKFPNAAFRYTILLIAVLLCNFLILELPFYEDYIPHAVCTCSIFFIISSSYVWYFSLLRKGCNVLEILQIILMEYSSWGKDSSWNTKLFNIIKGIGIISLFGIIYFFCYSKSHYYNPVIICLYYGLYLLLVAMIRGTNRMLYLSNKKNNKAYKKAINYNQYISYLVSASVVELGFIIMTGITYTICLFSDNFIEPIQNIFIYCLDRMYDMLFMLSKIWCILFFYYLINGNLKEIVDFDILQKDIKVYYFMKVVINLLIIIRLSFFYCLMIFINFLNIVSQDQIIGHKFIYLFISSYIGYIIFYFSKYNKISNTLKLFNTLLAFQAILLLCINIISDRSIPKFLLDLIFIIFSVGLVWDMKKDIIDTVYAVIAENFKRHYFLKHLFNTPKQIFVKINLGYEELKSIDVLRLISHNITIEYQKYLYTSSFFYWRACIIIVICLIITYFFHCHDYFGLSAKLASSTQDYINNGHSYFLYVKIIYDWIYGRIIYICNSIINIASLKEISPIPNNSFTIYDFIFFLVLIFLYKITAYIPIFNFLRAPYCNFRKLKTLQDSIGANIKKERKFSFGNLRKFTTDGMFVDRVEKNYPMSDAHDIEKRLIDILDDISNNKLYPSPQFVIIFDELDKIESSEENKEKTIKTDSFSPDIIRNRQEAVFKLLSSLKYILTTMQAKFIFVAGREIYEASLADAADRSHYVSSIFNDVINVPSFMSDFSDDKNRDICSMTEQYVCQQLLPENIIVDEFSLHTYYKYLEKKDKEVIINKNKEADYNKIYERERQKIIFTLHNFIVYLTYASKGAPKKMINLFENHVMRQQPYDYDLLMKEYVEKSVLPITRKYYKNTIFYLKFDFYEQYAINIMTRMVSPIIYRFNRSNIHQYGDKLIVSTFFVLDHLYKFHRYSFSWRALESSPELIDVDKTPELRDHITDLLHFLSQNDLKIIRNGLYDFRFFKKISQEICFLTRVSEYASAIFNFTLDESLAVKQFYRRKLNTIREQYKADEISKENAIDGLASIHFALGELSLYDEDIGEAIIEFDSALSILETLEPKDMTSEQIVVLIKTMLSLGIAYEKQNLNDRAMLIYSEAVRILVASRNIDISNFGLSSKENNQHKMEVSSKKYSKDNDEPAIYFKNCKDPKPLMELLDTLPHLHPDIHKIINKITVYESLRLLYLPLLAKFQMLEKSQNGGIQKEDIKRLLKEFFFLSDMLHKDNKNIIISTFYLKIGDILYYKNSKLIKIQEFNNILNKHDFNEDLTNDMQKNPQNTDALFFYKHSLITILPQLNFNNCLNSNKLIDTLYNQNFDGWDDTKLNLLATILTNIGDTILSTLEKGEEYKNAFYNFLKSFKEKRETKEKSETKEKRATKCINSLFNCKDKIKGKLSLIGLLYILSAWLYKKGTDYNMASFQYLRLLSIMRYHYPTENDNNIKTINDIAKYFVDKSIYNTRNAFKETHFENKQDIYAITKEDVNNKLLNCKYIIFDETFESIIAYQGIIFKDILFKIKNGDIKGESKEQEIKTFYKMFDTIRYENVSNIYNRLKFLKFKSEVNYAWFLVLCDVNPNPASTYVTSTYNDTDELEKSIKSTDTNSEKMHTISKVISDSIFNLMEILKFTKIYGETYLLTNLFVADTSHKLMKWLQVVQCIKNNKDQVKNFVELENQIDTHLTHLIGKEYQTKILEISNWANASRYYYKVKEMHSQGRTYKDLISRTCFLSDEYSDQRFHFITARERRTINQKELENICSNLTCKEDNKTENFNDLCKFERQDQSKS